MLQNKRYCCTDCDYIAKRSRDLKRHMQCHTGERSFMCAHCSYGAREKYHLKQHIMTHTKEAIHSRNNRYYCRQCGRIFTKDYLYKLHLETHKLKNFKCKYCPFVYNSTDMYEKHLLTHTDQKLFDCDECDRTFQFEHLLCKHKNFDHDQNCEAPMLQKGTEFSEFDEELRQKDCGNQIETNDDLSDKKVRNILPTKPVVILERLPDDVLKMYKVLLDDSSVEWSSALSNDNQHEKETNYTAKSFKSNDKKSTYSDVLRIQETEKVVLSDESCQKTELTPGNITSEDEMFNFSDFEDDLNPEETENVILFDESHNQKTELTPGNITSDDEMFNFSGFEDDSNSESSSNFDQSKSQFWKSVSDKLIKPVIVKVKRLTDEEIRSYQVKHETSMRKDIKNESRGSWTMDDIRHESLVRNTKKLNVVIHKLAVENEPENVNKDEDVPFSNESPLKVAKKISMLENLGNQQSNSVSFVQEKQMTEEDEMPSDSDTGFIDDLSLNMEIQESNLAVGNEPENVNKDDDPFGNESPLKVAKKMSMFENLSEQRNSSVSFVQEKQMTEGDEMLSKPDTGFIDDLSLNMEIQKSENPIELEAIPVSHFVESNKSVNLSNTYLKRKVLKDSVKHLRRKYKNLILNSKQQNRRSKILQSVTLETKQKIWEYEKMNRSSVSHFVESNKSVNLSNIYLKRKILKDSVKHLRRKYKNLILNSKQQNRRSKILQSVTLETKQKIWEYKKMNQRLLSESRKLRKRNDSLELECCEMKQEIIRYKKIFDKMTSEFKILREKNKRLHLDHYLMKEKLQIYESGYKELKSECPQLKENNKSIDLLHYDTKNVLMERDNLYPSFDIE